MITNHTRISTHLVFKLHLKERFKKLLASNQSNFPHNFSLSVVVCRRRYDLMHHVLSWFRIICWHTAQNISLLKMAAVNKLRECKGWEKMRTDERGSVFFPWHVFLKIFFKLIRCVNQFNGLLHPREYGVAEKLRSQLCWREDQFQTRT